MSGPDFSIYPYYTVIQLYLNKMARSIATLGLQMNQTNILFYPSALSLILQSRIQNILQLYLVLDQSPNYEQHTYHL
jgi:hypothetical protein